MLNLMELEQFVTFADCGTLSKAAELLHLSQPTVTRTMKNVEASFGVPLFIRNKNKIKLNETGIKAAACARSVLSSAQNAVQQIQAYHAKLHTIIVESCAPAPLWSLLPLLSGYYPEQTVSSRLSTQTEIVEAVDSGSSDIGIISYPICTAGLECIPVIREHLSACISRDHALTEHKTLTFDDLNGFNCLLRSQIGFWTELCHQKMPNSKFLVQTDEFAFQELVRSSTLPCFTTDLAVDSPGILKGRSIIPVTDSEANVTYYFICQKKKNEYIELANQLHAKHIQR